MNKLVDQKPFQARTATHLNGMGADQPTRISSQALLGDAGELVIEHAGREYRLRVTQNGKLILTA